MVILLMVAAMAFQRCCAASTVHIPGRALGLPIGGSPHLRHTRGTLDHGAGSAGRAPARRPWFAKRLELSDRYAPIHADLSRLPPSRRTIARWGRERRMAESWSWRLRRTSGRILGMRRC